jgi:Uma2 family endonuclease
MATQVRKMRASEFLALPVTNLHHELISGEEIMSPAPTGKHQRAVGSLFILIKRLAPSGEVLFAPVDVYLDDEHVVQPDVLWVAAGSSCTWFEDKYLRGAPDLVVEVFSPGTVRADRKDKFRLYEKFGVREYWMVDPDEKLLEIWQRKDGQFTRVDVFGPGDTCQSPLLGTVDVNAIFAEPAARG